MVPSGTGFAKVPLIFRSPFATKLSMACVGSTPDGMKLPNTDCVVTRTLLPKTSFKLVNSIGESVSAGAARPGEPPVFCAVSAAETSLLFVRPPCEALPAACCPMVT